MSPQCDCKTFSIFIKRLVTGSLVHGYWYYVAGQIPEKKDPTLTDKRIMEKYAVTSCRTTRMRRKQRGFCNVQYLRYGHRFILTATAGEGPFFAQEPAIRDFRAEPLEINGHLIGVRDKRPFVEIEKGRLAKIKHSLLERALHLPPQTIERQVQSLSSLNYSGVRTQKAKLIRRIHKARKQNGVYLKCSSISPFNRP